MVVVVGADVFPDDATGFAAPRDARRNVWPGFSAYGGVKLLMRANSSTVIL